MIKYMHTTEYNEHFDEVILDFSMDSSLKNGYLISNSLGSDIFGDFQTVKQEIENLLKLLLGEINLYKGGGNVNLIKSDKFFTTIEDIFIEEDDEEIICKIETVEYVKIIMAWAEENFRYKYARGALIKEEAEKSIMWLHQKRLDLCRIEDC